MQLAMSAEARNIDGLFQQKCYQMGLKGAEVGELKGGCWTSGILQGGPRKLELAAVNTCYPSRKWEGKNAPRSVSEVDRAGSATRSPEDRGLRGWHHHPE